MTAGFPMTQPSYGPSALAAATTFNGLPYGTLYFKVVTLTGGGNISFTDSYGNPLAYVNLATMQLSAGTVPITAVGNYAVTGGVSDTEWTLTGGTSPTATVTVAGRA